MTPIFPYDAMLAQAVRDIPQSIPDVLGTMRAIAAVCADGDGLKWFNWLYLEVTEAVEARVAAGGFSNPDWMAQLDVQFASLYFGALDAALSGQLCPGCWQALFSRRDQVLTARIQFALAGINAHINRDLPVAIVNTNRMSGIVPQHGTSQYSDYTALNSTLDGIIDAAKRTLLVRLLGDPLPPVSHLEDTVAAWSVGAAREAAWSNAEILWHLQSEPPLSAKFLNTLDGLTTFAGTALLAAVA